jgi:uncharacterized membrane protein YesL
MIGFFLKKAFFDGWDNLFTLAFINIGYIALVAGPILQPFSSGSLSWLSWLIIVPCVALLFIHTAASNLVLRDIADFKTPSFRDYFAYFRESWLTGLLFGLLLSTLIFIVSVAMPFYSALNSLLGLFAAAIVFWCLVVCLLGFQYFLPLKGRIKGGFRKTLKKCFLVFFDNPGFSLFLAIYNTITFLLSFLTAMLAPGPAGVLLSLNVGLRLRLYKYDYLEENPEADRRKIPWGVLTLDDKERVGKRTLKGMIFPWKD